MKLVEVRPDLGHCWVRYSFRPWPGSEALWLDLLGRGLGETAERTADVGAGPMAARVDDVTYLPPVGESNLGFRSHLAHRLRSGGAPLLVQSLPETELGLEGTTEVFDVLHSVATGDLAKLDLLSAGSAVIWPLIGGYTDGREKIDLGLGRLAAAGVTCVQGVAAELSPADRRRVVEVAGEGGFERLFHGEPPSERFFAGAVHRSGMIPFLPRPLPEAPSRLKKNRQVAGMLAMIGELWLRLGRTESRGQAFYRAARWVDDDNHDILALAREGNLGVVSWLDEDSRQVIGDFPTGRAADLLDELKGEYLTSPGVVERSDG